MHHNILSTWVSQIYPPLVTATTLNTTLQSWISNNKELATYDQLPEFSVELARLLKEGVEEKGRWEGVTFPRQQFFVLGVLSWIDWFDVGSDQLNPPLLMYW